MSSSPRWTIAELGRKVAEALAVGYQGPPNGQVRAVPNQRSIRYYTTLGLLDRPVDMRGRTALYGPRHLRQLVAIKRLQAQGQSLAEIQEILAGASPRKLAAIARVPDALLAGAAPADSMDSTLASDNDDEPRQTTARSTDFWAALPREETCGDTDTDGVASADEERGLAADAQGHADTDASLDAAILARIDLAPGVSLVVEPARALGRGDVVAIRRAAAAVMNELVERGIWHSPGARTPDIEFRGAHRFTREHAQAQAQARSGADGRAPHQGDNHGTSNRSDDHG